MVKIDDTSLVPKYHQVKNQLIERIISGEWKHGEKIPAEKEIVASCNCSLITVNKAVGQLVDEGYAFRERGRGTFVSPKNLWGKVDKPIVLKLIGMMVPDVTQEFSRNIVRGVEDYLHTRGYSLILGNHDQDSDKAQTYMTLLQKKMIDGIIFSPVIGDNYEEKNKRILKKANQKDIPIVLVDKYLHSMNLSYVTSENVESSYKMTENLIKSGHKKIAIITGMSCTSFDDRLIGYKKALEEYSIPFNPNLILQYEAKKIDDGNVDGIVKFLTEKREFSAIFSFNSTLANGLVLAFKELNLDVPDDLALVSYDNHILPNSAETIFLRLNQPEYKMGEKAAELLIKMIEKGIREQERVILKSEILKRKINNNISIATN